MAGDRWSPGSERRSTVLASSDQLHLKHNRHKLYICDDADRERLVEFSINVKDIDNFADFYHHVKTTLDVRRFDVGTHYRSVHVCCYSMNQEKNAALVQITVLIAPSTLMLCTGGDVFLHYVYGLRRAGYKLRKKTRTVCMRRCLVRQQHSISKDYSPMMRALFLDVIHSKFHQQQQQQPQQPPPPPPPVSKVVATEAALACTPASAFSLNRRCHGGGGVFEVRYRRHSANLERAAQVYYPAAAAAGGG